jgi:hypothetical protein
MGRKMATTIVTAGAAALFAGLSALAPAASALVLPPGGLVNAPHYCVAVYGDPNPCPPPDRPDPIDPDCLRVDILPLKCPYLP